MCLLSRIFLPSSLESVLVRLLGPVNPLKQLLSQALVTSMLHAGVTALQLTL